jgi:hypothetical protein
MTKEQQQPKQNQMDRRECLGLIAKFIVGVAAGGAPLVMQKIMEEATTFPTSSNLSAEMTPTPLRSEKHLMGTATAVAETGTNFEPKGKYTEKFHRKMHDATFKLQYIGVARGKNEGANQQIEGTTWLAKATKDYLYFVTNKHVVTNEYEIEIDSVMLGRPQKDSGYTRYKLVNQIDSDKYDVSLLKVERPKGRTIKDETVMAYKDDQELDGDALALGYPGIFKGSGGMKGSVWSQVITIRFEESAYVADATNSHGSSGSPIAINVDGKPIVVGMIFAGPSNGDDQLYATPLDLDELFEKIDK